MARYLNCPVCGEVKHDEGYAITTFPTRDTLDREPCCEECFDQFHADSARARADFQREYEQNYIRMKQQERYALLDQARNDAEKSSMYDDLDDDGLNDDIAFAIIFGE